jgi:hypothetical protein
MNLSGSHRNRENYGIHDGFPPQGLSEARRGRLSSQTWMIRFILEPGKLLQHDGFPPQGLSEARRGRLRRQTWIYPIHSGTRKIMVYMMGSRLRASPKHSGQIKKTDMNNPVHIWIRKIIVNMMDSRLKASLRYCGAVRLSLIFSLPNRYGGAPSGVAALIIIERGTIFDHIWILQFSNGNIKKILNVHRFFTPVALCSRKIWYPLKKVIRPHHAQRRGGPWGTGTVPSVFLSGSFISCDKKKEFSEPKTIRKFLSPIERKQEDYLSIFVPLRCQWEPH